MTPFGGFTDGAGTGVMLMVTEVLVSKLPASMRSCACGGDSMVKTSDVGNAVPAEKTLETGCGAGLPPRNRYGSAMQLPSKIGGEPPGSTRSTADSAATATRITTHPQRGLTAANRRRDRRPRGQWPARAPLR